VPPPLHHLDPSIPPALSAAVERALALTPRRRYASADEMRTAIVDGARGIGPDGDATRVAGHDDDATSATTVLAGEPAPGPMVVPREPRAPRRPAPAPAAPPAAYAEQPPRGRSQASSRRAAQQRRRRRGGLRRLVTFLLLIAVLAAAGAAAYLATSTGDNSVRLRQVVHDNADQVVDDLKQLIQDNTR